MAEPIVKEGPPPDQTEVDRIAAQIGDDQDVVTWTLAAIIAKDRWFHRRPTDLPRPTPAEMRRAIDFITWKLDGYEAMASQRSYARPVQHAAPEAVQ